MAATPADDPTRYVVIYRMGGDIACSWKRCFPTYTHGMACSQVVQLTASGYKAFMRTEEEHRTLGFPIGWSPELVDFEQDEIVVTAEGSRWYMAAARRRAA